MEPWEIAATLALAVIVAVALVAFVTKILPKDCDQADLQLCRASVQLKSAAAQMTDLNCETCYRDDIARLEKKEQVMNAVSDAFYECWYMFGEGQYHAFEGEVTDKVAHCFICSKFQMPKTFDGSTSEKRIQAPELPQFMRSDKYKNAEGFVYDFVEKGFIEVRGEKKLLFKQLKFPKTADEVVLDRLKDSLQFPGPGIPTIPELSTTLLMHAIFAYSLEDYSSEYNNLLYSKRSGVDNDFVVLYYQFSEYFLKQLPLVQVMGSVVGEGALANAVQKATQVPPGYVFLTRFSDVQNLGCEVLQG
ncbi:hypothetical protein HYS48_05400 [Candidatus Woesearchaeota archaeon]|nr:hypothetical protein [Candidatus Woesearchaeota archaeon]